MTRRSFLAMTLLTATMLAGLHAPARADALAAIRKAGVIRVGVFADFPPFSSVNPDMSLAGYDVDMANLIGKALGVKTELVAVTGQNRIPFLTEGRVDLLLSVGYSDERARVIDFAAAYAPYYIAVMGPKALKVGGPADLADKVIAVNRGTLEDASLTKAAPAGAEIRRFDNYNAVLQAFLSGQAQLMAVGNNVGAQVLARRTDLQPEEKFQLLSSPDHVGLRKGEPALQAALNAIVEKAKADGTLNAFSEKWLKRPLDEKGLIRPGT